MAKERDEIGLDFDDDEFDAFLSDDSGWDDFDEELTDGSENKKKSRKPIDALKNALGDSFKENQTKEAYIEEAKKRLPHKFSVVTDDVETYIRTGQELFEESRKELTQSASKLKLNANRLVKAYERQLPGPLAKLLDKLTKSEPTAEEVYQRQQESDEQKVVEELNKFNQAQLELQQLSESREMLRDKNEEKRFESQQELLYGISTGIQRQIAQEEQIAFKQRNKLIEIGYHQLYAQRGIQKSLLESSNHAKQALDSIVKNTSLPDIVKSKNSEVMKDLFLRSTLGKVGNKFTDYLHGFKDKFIQNATTKIQERVNAATGTMDTVSGMMDMMAGVKEMDNEFGGPKDKTELIGGLLGSLLSKAVTSKATGSVLNRIDKTGKLSGLIENAYGKVKHLPTTANRFKDKHEGESNLLGFIADLIPGSSEDKLTHQMSASYNLNQQAQFDVATRRSIVDVIPQLLAKIHQSTEGIRYGINPNAGDLDDGNLLEWDNETATLNTRSKIDKRTLVSFTKLTRQDRQFEYAIRLVNLIDEDDILSNDVKMKLAKEFMTTLGKRKGFQAERFLTPDYKWQYDFTDDEKIIIQGLIREKFISDHDLDKISDVKWQRRKRKAEDYYNDMESLRGEVADRSHKESLYSDTELARMTRLGLGKFENGTYSTVNDRFDNKKYIDKAANHFNKEDFSSSRYKTDLTDEYDLDSSEYQFKQQKGYKDNPDGSLGTIENPRPRQFMFNLKGDKKPKKRLTYREWLEYLNQYGRIDADEARQSGLRKTAKAFGNAAATAFGGIAGYDNEQKLRNTVSNGLSTINNAYNEGLNKTGLSTLFNKADNGLQTFLSSIYDLTKDVYYNKQFSVFDLHGMFKEEEVRERADRGDKLAQEMIRIYHEEGEDKLKEWIATQIRHHILNDPDLPKDIKQKAEEAFENATTTAVDAVNTNYKKVEKLVEDYKEDPKEFKKQTKKKLKKKGKRLTKRAKQVKNVSTQKIEEIIQSDLGQSLISTATSVKDSATSNANKVSDFVNEQLNKTENGRKVLKAVDDAIANITDAIETNNDKMQGFRINSIVGSDIGNRNLLSSYNTTQATESNTFGKSSIGDQSLTEAQRDALNKDNVFTDNIEEDNIHDVYVKGEEYPRLLAIKIKNRDYRTKETNNVVTSLLDIDSTVMDETGRDVITLEEIANNKLVIYVDGKFKQALSYTNIQKASKILSGIDEDNRSDAETRAVASSKDIKKQLKILAYKPFEKIHKYFYKAIDVYLRPESKDGEPRRIMTRFGMIQGKYMTKEGKIIDGVDKIKGAVYNAETGEMIASDEEMLRACDSKGRKLSSSYLVRRFRLAKDMLRKTMWNPAKFAAKTGFKATKFLAKGAWNVTKGSWGLLNGKAPTDEEDEEEPGLIGKGFNRLKSVGNFMGKFIPKKLKNKLKRKDGIVVDERTGNKRGNNYQDLMKSQDDDTKKRNEDAKARQDAELKRREENNKKDTNPMMKFLSDWFFKIFGLDGLLVKGVGAVLSWVMGKSLLGSMFDKLKDWAFGNKKVPDVDMPNSKSKPGSTSSKATKRGLAGRAWESVKDGTSKVWKGAKKIPGVEKAAGFLNKHVGSKLATTVGKFAGKKALQVGAVAGLTTLAGGALAGGALAAAAPIVAALLTAWTIYEIGSMVWDLFKSTPNKVDDFRIAAYGVDPENSSRAKIVLALEKWAASKVRVDGSGTLQMPNLMQAVAEKDKQAMAILGELGGGEDGKAAFSAMSPEEQNEYSTRVQEWYDHRFSPVFYQHAISLYQIDKEATLANAFDRVGGIKFGLVYPWLRRAYFKADDPENPYVVQIDPFFMNEDDDEDTIKKVGQTTVDKYYEIVVNAYKKDEEELRKSEAKREKNGGKKVGYFDFEEKTERFSKENSGNKGQFRSTQDENVKRNLFNKDLTVAKTELIGNTVYLYDPIENVNLDGRSVIDDGDVVRVRMYGLNSLVTHRVKALLSLEKEMVQYIKFGNTASFDKFDFLKIASKYAPLLNWDTSSENDLAMFKAWFENRFSPTLLGFANIVYRKFNTKDILNFVHSEKLTAMDKYELYAELIGIKTFYNGEEYEIWKIPFQVVKGLDVNTSSGTVTSNILNLERGMELKVLTEKDPNSLSSPKEPDATKKAVDKASSTANIDNKGLTSNPSLPSNLSSPSSSGTPGQFGGGKFDGGGAGGSWGGDVKDYKVSKKPDKIKLAKTVMDEINKLGWSENEKNHFLAQITHESGGLKHLEELGNASYFAGKSYGQKWKGRGIIQLTHEANYKKFAEWINRPDILEKPQLVAEEPYLAVQSAIHWWETKKKESKKFRDAVQTDDVLAVSKGVNGVNKSTGMPNHYNDRLNQYKLYKSGKGVIREMAGASSDSEIAGNTPVTDSITPTVNEGLTNSGTMEPVTNSGPDADKSEREKLLSLTSFGNQLETTQIENVTGDIKSKFEEHQWTNKDDSNAMRLKEVTYNQSSAPEVKTSGSWSTLENETNTSSGSTGAGMSGNYQEKTVTVPGNPSLKVKITKKGMELLAKATPELVNLGKQYTQHTGNGKLISGMVPEFVTLFYAAVGDFVKETGNKMIFNVYSAFRDHATQLRLFAENKRQYPPNGNKKVATPGGSPHEYGIAFDIRNVGKQIDGNDFKNGLLSKWEQWGSKEKWGFYRRLRPGVTNVHEDWHVENVHFLKDGKPSPGQTPDGGIDGSTGMTNQETQQMNSSNGLQGGGYSPDSVSSSNPNTATGLNPLTEDQKSQITAESVVGVNLSSSGQTISGYTDAVNQGKLAGDIQSSLNTQDPAIPRDADVSTNKLLEMQSNSVETQQQKLADVQKEQSNNMSNILNEQLIVQKSIDGNLSKLIEFIMNKKPENMSPTTVPSQNNLFTNLTNKSKSKGTSGPAVNMSIGSTTRS